MGGPVEVEFYEGPTRRWEGRPDPTHSYKIYFMEYSHGRDPASRKIYSELARILQERGLWNDTVAEMAMRLAAAYVSSRRSRRVVINRAEAVAAARVAARAILMFHGVPSLDLVPRYAPKPLQKWTPEERAYNRALKRFNQVAIYRGLVATARERAPRLMLAHAIAAAREHLHDQRLPWEPVYEKIKQLARLVYDPRLSNMPPELRAALVVYAAIKASIPRLYTPATWARKLGIRPMLLASVYQRKYYIIKEVISDA